MARRRALLWIRLLVGAGFMYQGVTHVLEMRSGADLFAASADWQAWPLVGALRPLELVLWLALTEFFLGVFLFCGLLTRILGVVAALVAGFQLAALGPGAGVLNALLALGSAAITFRGGGGGTMDAVLGKMQRRSIERAAERARAARSQESGARSQEISLPPGS
jgi:uncharacterized membrane protein YphA (DoxX/SURF4 family)